MHFLHIKFEGNDNGGDDGCLRSIYRYSPNASPEAPPQSSSETNLPAEPQDSSAPEDSQQSSSECTATSASEEMVGHNS